MCQQINQTWVQIMPCRVFGAKPLSESMVAYCSLNIILGVLVTVTHNIGFHRSRALWGIMGLINRVVKRVCNKKILYQNINIQYYSHEISIARKTQWWNGCYLGDVDTIRIQVDKRLFEIAKPLLKCVFFFCLHGQIQTMVLFNHRIWDLFLLCWCTAQ